MIVSDFTGIEAADVDLTPCAAPCDADTCFGCASVECPHGEPLHRDKDGCPACERWDGSDDSPVIRAALAAWDRCPYAVVGGPVVEAW